MATIRKVKVIVLTTAYRLEGEIQVSEGATLMDELNRAREFIPLHKATLFDPVGGQALDTLEFIAVNKPQVLMIAPVKAGKQGYMFAD